MRNGLEMAHRHAFPGRVSVLWRLIVWSSMSLLCCNAYKAQNYNPYKYDLGNIMFTPDGRLLQVEYAIKATEYSAPIYIVRLNDDLVVVACAVNKKRSQNGYSGSVMERLIVLPNNSRSKDGTSSPIIVSVAGVLTDGLALLQKLQGDLLKDFQYFGGTHQATAYNVAEKLATYCHENCFLGGIRPYGAMVWTMGLGDGGELEVYQTSPSGAIQSVELPDDRPLMLGRGDSDNALRKLEQEASQRPAETIARIATLLSSDEKEPEILLLSTTRGALKLTPDQVQSYLQRNS